MSDLPQQPPPSNMMPPGLAQRLFGGGPVPEVFANQLRMGVTVTDFTIVFGTAVDMGGTAVVADRAIVHVAPGMLKQILQNLIMAVNAYEEVMGEIRVPKPLEGQLANLKTQVISMLRQQMDGPAPEQS